MNEITSDDFDFTETNTPQELLDPGDYYTQDYEDTDVNAFYGFLEIG